MSRVAAGRSWIASTVLALGVGLPVDSAAQVKLSGIGDSIIQAYSANGILGDQPAYSFAQGTDTTVQAIYLRYQDLHPGISKEFESVSGAEMVGGSNNAAAQAGRICAQATKPDRVVLLLGGNDVCNRAKSSSSDATANMYAVDTFRNALRAALDNLGGCLPAGSVVEALSMPRVDYLYEAKVGSVWCRFVWWIAGICRIVTDEGDASRRRQIGRRIDAYNQALKDEVLAAEAAYGASRGVHFLTDWMGPMDDYPDTSVGAFVFTSADVNDTDCFHPYYSTGQRKLACVGWETLEGDPGSIPDVCLGP